jgi:phage terminase small subunit
MDKLSKQDQEFVKQVAITGNQTQSAKDAYGIESDDYARKKGSVQVAKGNINTAIQEVKRSLADRIPDDLLEQVHIDGLNAVHDKGVDYAVRHKYLDSAYKLKGSYAAERSINLNIEAEITNPHARELAEKYEEELKKGL